MLFALLLAAVPAQFCRDLGPDERILCNQIYEVSKKLDKMDTEQDDSSRLQQTHEVRIKNLEQRISEFSIDIRELLKYRDESTGERRLEVALAGIIAGFVMSFLNRTLAKRDKANGKG